ncbi:hypothetical protein DTL70_21130 [Streptomyces diacarni]|uniref:Uncharacterized protein n=1 Tax=Streptomyces diacarni TaxID=2800381 RepID=A0A367EUD5_9ACTN|nr:hypothetical protein [Streptomyces diacarni]RCG20780.1 hypothetical protein DTL70_21130 [Streptomyces diacarni]
METPYEITTLTRTDQTNPPAHLVRAPLGPAEIPPGVELVTLPDGRRTLAYTQAPATAPPLAAAPSSGVPGWAKTTALLAPTLGAGIGAGGFGLSYAAPGVIAMTNALWAAVALIATGCGGAALLLGRWRNRAPAHITQNITAHGFMSRAGGTINHH